jgi:hypothetical protein
MLKLSRSHLATRKFCARKGWLTYWYPVEGKPRGVVPRRLNVAQAVGSLTHGMLEGVLRYVKANGLDGSLPVDNILAATVKMWVAEVEAKGFDAPANIMLQAALAEGMARAWIVRRLPTICEFYDVIAVEEEWELDLEGCADVKLMVRLDGVLRRKLDGVLSALEFKTAGFDKESYFESWRYATQTLLHILALQQHYPDAQANSVLMEFMLKGYHRTDKNGVDQFYSPLVRVLCMGPNLGYLAYDSEVAKRKGITTCYSYEYPGGVQAWVAQLMDVQLDAALATREIQRNDAEFEEWLEQTSYEVSIVQSGLSLLGIPFGNDNPTMMTNVLRRYFPARLDQECYADRYGHKCVYCDLCHGEVDDPLESGLFVPRDPHHELEFSEEE